MFRTNFRTQNQGKMLQFILLEPVKSVLISKKIMFGMMESLNRKIYCLNNRARRLLRQRSKLTQVSLHWKQGLSSITPRPSLHGRWNSLGCKLSARFYCEEIQNQIMLSQRQSVLIRFRTVSRSVIIKTCRWSHKTERANCYEKMNVIISKLMYTHERGVSVCIE